MPRYTKAQIAARRRLAAIALASVFLLIVGGCTIALTRALVGHPSHTADDSALTIAAPPSGAAALNQLPGDVTLEASEAMGIDVSVHQGTINWEGVASDGYTFAYIKATEGTNYVDPQFTANWSGAQKSGLTVGAYHYFTLCSPGKEQADDFLDAVAVSDTHLPPALDLEFDGACNERPESHKVQQEIEDFLRVVEDAWGRRAVIYSSSEWREHYGLPQSDGRPDWLYSDSGRPTPADWALWQLRFDGTVSGITGDVDIDVARVSEIRSHASIGPKSGASDRAE